MANSFSKKRKKVNRKFNGNGKIDKGSRKDIDGYKFDERDATNDPAWYAKYPELMKDAASLPYSIPTGTKISWDVVCDPSKPLIEDGVINYTAYQSIPGIMVFGVWPTCGVSVDATSPVNVASDMLYTKVRAENSGAKNYDSPDLMLYCLGMDQVYSLLTWYNRIYGTMMLYSQVNRYLPKAMLEAQWVDADDMLIHINDFKAFLDTAIAQAAVFSVPNDIALFNRHAFMYQNVYKDAESAKSQMYMFAPRAFYAYNELSGPGKLNPIDVVNTFPNKLKFADLVRLFHMLMDPIISSEDFNIMSGDILKAFGENSLIKLQLMPSGYTIMPLTDYEVLTQMKNATLSNLMTSFMLGVQSGNIDASIHQDANVDYIVWDPALTTSISSRHTFSRDRFLSTYKTSPEPSDNMVYSRLMFATKELDLSETGSPSYETHFDAVGSEFITSCNVFLFHTSQGVWTCDSKNISVVSDNTATVLDRFFITYLAKHFDFCPALYMFSTDTGYTYFYPFFDVDNWTIVHAYELEKMHRTAIMSMLRVPMIGSALPNVK